MKRQFSWLLTGTAFLSLSACATNPDGSYEWKRTGIGALTGAAVGAGTGAIFGGGKGAAIGAVAGTAVGAGVGSYMDHQAAALKKALPPETKIERQGDKVFVTLPAGILFAKGKDTLQPAALDSLAKAALTLRESQTDIIIQGHTDSTGSDAVNMPLSQGRADRVKNYLIAQGVPSSRLVAVGYGSSRPAYPNDSEATRALNRRVQLEISPNSALKTQQSQPQQQSTNQ